MKYRLLGDTGITVSELCFGTLTISPLQANFTLREGMYLIEHAFERGITFFDTASLYRSYGFFNKINTSTKEKMVIASKSYAVDYQEMMDDIDQALKDIGRDFIDIFKLHEQESVLTLKGHMGAIEALLDAKKSGKIRATGISTHSVALTGHLLLKPELDVVHPLFNYKGHGYIHGSIEEQENNIAQLFASGKGIYVMKPFGGGRFSFDFMEAFAYVQRFAFKHSLAIGMKSKEEIEVNIALIENRFNPEMIPLLQLQERKIFYRHELCSFCMECIHACPSKAMIISDQNCIAVDHAKCLLCCYCLSRCPNLALRLL